MRLLGLCSAVCVVREQLRPAGQLLRYFRAGPLVKHRSMALLAVIALVLVCFGLAAIFGNSGASISASSQTAIAAPIIKPSADLVVGRREPVSAREVTVLNGDTIHTRNRTVRLIGFDAPEIGSKAQCPRERELGARATEQLRALVAGGGLDLRLVACPCPSGTEGTSACNDGHHCGELRSYGRDIGRIMTAYLLAKPSVCSAHSCPHAKSWC